MYIDEVSKAYNRIRNQASSKEDRLLLYDYFMRGRRMKRSWLVERLIGKLEPTDEEIKKFEDYITEIIEKNL